MTSPTGRIEAIAIKLASSKVRFITDLQIGAYRRQYGATRDEVRAAAIMADRIRRQEQIAENRPTFAVHAIVGPDTPITLPNRQRSKWRIGNP
jgi:hypothetical protein